MEAIDIVKSAVETNGGNFHPSTQRKLSLTTVKPFMEESYGVSDLFVTPNLRFRAINTAFNWFAIALCFYGLAFNTGGLHGDPYLVFFLSGLADLPGHLLVILVVDKTGRRSLNAVLLFLGGAACVATTLIPKGYIKQSLCVLNNHAISIFIMHEELFFQDSL